MKAKLRGLGVLVLYWVFMHYDRWWFLLPYTLMLSFMVHSGIAALAGLGLALAMFYGALCGMMANHTVSLNLPNKEKEKTK